MNISKLFKQGARVVMVCAVSIVMLTFTACEVEERVPSGIEDLSEFQEVAVQKAISDCGKELKNTFAKTFEKDVDFTYEKSGGRNGDFVVKGFVHTSFDDSNGDAQPVECVFKFVENSETVESIDLLIDGETVEAEGITLNIGNFS